MAKPAKTPQEVAEQKRYQAERMVLVKIRELARATTSLRFWQRKAVRFAKLANMTDAEVEAERTKRKVLATARAAARQRRGIKVGGTA